MARFIRLAKNHMKIINHQPFGAHLIESTSHPATIFPSIFFQRDLS
jgi:hypothetical protein